MWGGWLRQTKIKDMREMVMSLGDRIRSLRIEKKWTQAELAERVEADARRISLYETEKTTPSVEALVRIAQLFEVSLDYLVMDAPRRAVQAKDQELLRCLEGLKRLPKGDRESVLHIIDSLVAKTRLKELVQDL